MFDGRNNGAIMFETNDAGSQPAERMRLDSSGRLLLGQTSADTDLGGYLQVVGTNYAKSSVLQARMSANVYGPALDFLKSRNATWGSHTIVQNGDDLGRIYFRGDDGVDYGAAAALIMGEVDGTPGAGDMPGRLIFSTSADGSESPTERVRIKSDGITQITNAGEATYGTGVTAINIGNGMNVSMADDASFTMSSVCNTGGLIAVGTTKDASGNIRYRHALFFAQYGSSSVTELSDLDNDFATSDSDGSVCVYATGNTNGDIVIKNRLGHTTNICVSVVRFLGN